MFPRNLAARPSTLQNNNLRVTLTSSSYFFTESGPDEFNKFINIWDKFNKLDGANHVAENSAAAWFPKFADIN